MKKVKILSHPIQIATIRLDELGEENLELTNDKAAKSLIRKWRKLRHEMA